MSGRPWIPRPSASLACDAGIHRLITGPGSSILDFGHENRLVSDNLFLALVARDQHCRWPGCTIRATWCDAHHIVHRADHGPTNDENLVLLCHRHHQLSHQRGWKIDRHRQRTPGANPDGSIETSRPPGHRPARSAGNPSRHDRARAARRRRPRSRRSGRRRVGPPARTTHPGLMPTTAPAGLCDRTSPRSTSSVTQIRRRRPGGARPQPDRLAPRVKRATAGHA